MTLTAAQHTQAIARDFSRAANSYEHHALLQRQITHHHTTLLAQHLCTSQTSPLILDIGCGTGFFAQYCHTHHPSWQIIQGDLAPAMARIAARHAHMTCCMDMNLLPLRDASCTAIFSSSSIQWNNTPAVAFKEFARCLAPDGILCLSSFGLDTLKELRQCYDALALPAPLLDFLSLDELRTIAQDAGFILRASTSTIAVELHPHLLGLMRHLHAIGAGYKHSSRPLTRAQLQQMHQHYQQIQSTAPTAHTKEWIIPLTQKGDDVFATSPLYASYEILTLIAQKPER